MTFYELINDNTMYKFILKYQCYVDGADESNGFENLKLV